MFDSDQAYALSQRIMAAPGFYELAEKMLNDEAVIMTLQPRLEFLASIEVSKDIEDIILKFFDQVKLSAFEWNHDPEINKYSVRADTYLLTVEVLPPCNGQIPKANIALVTVEAEDFLELQTLRDVFLEYDLSSLFRDFILVWDTDGATRSWFSYIALNVLENQIRKLIVSRLMGIEDGRWWDTRIKPSSGGTYLKYKKSEENAKDVTHYPEDIMSDIFYTDFGALEKVISHSNNWQDVFEEVFRTKKYIERLKFLNRLRKKIAHNRFLSERNQKDLKDLYSNFNHAFRRIWGQR